MSLRRLAIPACMLALSACGSDDLADGSFRVAVWGEEFIEDGIPSSVFNDGWSVSFDRFLIAIGEVQVEDGETVAVNESATRVFDLTQSSAGAGHVLMTASVPGGTYDHADYTVLPATAAALAGNTSAANVSLMATGGYSLYVEGTASKGTRTISFAWGFTNRTRFEQCELASGTVDGGTASGVLTIHSDHLFYDDLFSETPNVAFDLVASADANEDDDVSEAELAAVDIRGESRYQVGSTGITDLWSYIVYQTGSVGHIDGEGHCDVTLR